MASSALALILAAVTVPANGPERVSGETEQGLDLNSRCAGILWTQDFGFQKGFLLKNRIVWHDEKGRACTYATDVIDEGGGKFRMDGDIVGIYWQEGECLWMCYHRDGRRPTSFRLGSRQDLLILHRLKPRK